MSRIISIFFKQRKLWNQSGRSFRFTRIIKSNACSVSNFSSKDQCPSSPNWPFSTLYFTPSNPYHLFTVFATKVLHRISYFTTINHGMGLPRVSMGSVLGVKSNFCNKKILSWLTLTNGQRWGILVNNCRAHWNWTGEITRSYCVSLHQRQAMALVYRSRYSISYWE